MGTPGRGADAVVVGGGIVGVCAALQLQRSGREVTLIERGVLGEEASGHNGGVFSADCLPTGLPSVIRSLPRMLRDPMSPLAIRFGYLPRLAPWLARFALNSRASRVEVISTALNSLMSRGIDAYRPLVAGTEAADILDNHGFLFVYQKAASLSAAQFVLDLRRRRGVEYDVLDADQLSELSPVLAGRFTTGVYLTKALFTRDPGGFTRTLANSFVAAGGTVRTAEVTGFERHGDRVSSVVTSDGTVAAGSVVLAAGPWSRGLLRKLGTNVPLDVERGYGIDLPDPGITLDRPMVLSEFHVGMSPRPFGIQISGLDELAGIEAAPNFALTDRIARAAKTAFPELRTDGGKPWMRRRPSMPDSLPVIGRAPKQENVYLAFGHGHKGMGMGAITGQLVQELMDNQRPTVDLAPFRPTRFALRRRAATAATVPTAAS